MGAKLSTAQKRLIIQVEGILVGGGIVYEKPVVEKLIKWVSSEFPEVSPDLIKNPAFWRRVKTRLSELFRPGDASLIQLARLVAQIRKILKEEGSSEQATVRVKRCPSSVSHPSSVSSPSVPNTPSRTPKLKTGILKGAPPQTSQAQGVPSSPGPLQNTRSPRPESSGQTLGGSSTCPASPAPVPKPQSYVPQFVESPVCPGSPLVSQDGRGVTQNGGDRMVEMAGKPPSSSQNPFLPSSNPFLPLGHSPFPAPSLPTSPHLHPLSDPSHLVSLPPFPMIAPPIVPPTIPPLSPPTACHCAPPPAPASGDGPSSSGHPVSRHAPSSPSSGSHAPPSGSHGSGSGGGGGSRAGNRSRPLYHRRLRLFTSQKRVGECVANGSH
ncbi:uncharacterized protein [Molothrus aeneus]|uniref:uncharacterized protein n=1 Tax=Molothrus aeneus TaxID=84833 RepID=UPI003459ABF0